MVNVDEDNFSESRVVGVLRCMKGAILIHNTLVTGNVVSSADISVPLFTFQTLLTFPLSNRESRDVPWMESGRVMSSLFLSFFQTAPADLTSTQSKLYGNDSPESSTSKAKSVTADVLGQNPPLSPETTPIRKQWAFLTAQDRLRGKLSDFGHLLPPSPTSSPNLTPTNTSPPKHVPVSCPIHDGLDDERGGDVPNTSDLQCCCNRTKTIYEPPLNESLGFDGFRSARTQNFNIATNCSPLNTPRNSSLDESILAESDPKHHTLSRHSDHHKSSTYFISRS